VLDAEGSAAIEVPGSGLLATGAVAVVGSCPIGAENLPVSTPAEDWLGTVFDKPTVKLIFSTDEDGFCAASRAEGSR